MTYEALEWFYTGGADGGNILSREFRATLPPRLRDLAGLLLGDLVYESDVDGAVWYDPDALLHQMPGTTRKKLDLVLDALVSGGYVARGDEHDPLGYYRLRVSIHDRPPRLPPVPQPGRQVEQLFDPDGP
jgi:hypothetical protein